MGRHEDLRAPERELWAQGFEYVAGVDEAGRGALAGPLVAAAAVLPERLSVKGIRDSKRLTASARARIYEELTAPGVCCWACAIIEPDEIDRIGIQAANIEAMIRAVLGLPQAAHFVLTDHFKLAGLDIPQRGIDQGDRSCRCIAAASILAKVTRDRIMDDLDRLHPEYGFAEHKGYGTAGHLVALQKHGPSPHHRYSFRNVGQMKLG